MIWKAILDMPRLARRLQPVRSREDRGEDRLDVEGLGENRHVQLEEPVGHRAR